jgi:hypothetical protein
VSAETLDREGRAEVTATFDRLDEQEFDTVNVEWEVSAAAQPDDSVGLDGGVSIQELQ